MRYLIRFSYDGTSYNGFQKQRHLDNTIQGKMELALKQINNGKDTKLTASGRTDRGVHALDQCAHVDIDVDITPYKLKRALNSLLEGDIHVFSVEEVDSEFHARYMVKKKTYMYKINVGEYNPIERNIAYQLGKKLDVDKMNKAIKDFIGKHDFSAFCSNEDKKEDCNKEIYDAYIKEDGDTITIFFEGNGFLKYMVRTMVGYLIEIGLGKRDNDIKERFKESKRSKIRTANPEGLYLYKVEY